MRKNQALISLSPLEAVRRAALAGRRPAVANSLPGQGRAAMAAADARRGIFNFRKQSNMCECSFDGSKIARSGAHGTHRAALVAALCLALLFAAASPVTGERPPVEVVCCPTSRTYLHEAQPSTALMTYPGSGNTWVRHIIETLTGYHTTSVYCDKTLQPVFKAECDHSDRFNMSIVVKTHKLKYCARWGRAIVVIRNPLHSIRGEYQRLNTHSHTGLVDPEDWDWEDWYDTSTRMCENWTRMFAEVFGDTGRPGCAATPGNNYKVFFYEDLKTPSGALNPYFLDELLSWFGIDKSSSFHDCALKFNKGHYARELPADHPAAMLLNDTETLSRFARSGCMAAFESYWQRFPHLPQPLETI